MTKEEFLEVYEKYQPQKIAVWFFKYFSQSTKQEDRKPGQIFMWSMVGLIASGIVFKAIAIPIMVAIVTYTFAAIFVPFCIVGLYCVIQNNFRIRKIAKELGLNLSGYNKYANKYL
jgi:hypothetical protein